MIDKKAVLQALGPQAKRFSITVVPEVDSTQVVLRQSGKAPGDVVIAEVQTAGRGRMGRSFLSDEGGLYMSVLLCPKEKGFSGTAITAAAGVAVAEAITDLCGLTPEIKWVNDLQIGGKKLAGILAEGQISSDGDYQSVILGMGVNVNSSVQRLEQCLPGRATSLAVETGMPQSIEALAARVLLRLLDIGLLDTIVPDLWERYRSRLITLSQTVCVRGDPSGIRYRVLDIDRQFGLIVESPEGTRRTLYSGEVSVIAG